jgi:flagellar protein FliJ
MLSSKRLTPIVGLAERKEETEAREMGHKQTDLAVSQDQLASLTAMRNGYIDNFQASGTLVSASRLKEFRSFMNKLDKAIIQQQSSVQTSAVALDYQRQNWIQAHTRKRSLEKVVDNRKLSEMKHQEKLEQKEMDEHAQRQFSKQSKLE